MGRYLLFISLLIFVFTAYSQDYCVTYKGLRQQIEQQRLEFNKIYLLGDSASRKMLIAQARDFVFETITDDIFSFWYGTPWDFNGITETPGSGKIACGYFVTTVMRDAGFDIPRVKWAQCASEVMVKKISKDIHRFRDRPMEELQNHLMEQKEGIYIVGLDYHVGFIVRKGSSVQFVHSNYYQSDIGVMAENTGDAIALRYSRYKVLGKILGDEMIIKWLLRERFE